MKNFYNEVIFKKNIWKINLKFSNRKRKYEKFRLHAIGIRFKIAWV